MDVVSGTNTLKHGTTEASTPANLFDWGEFLLALHGKGAQVRLHVLQQFLHRFGTAGRHLVVSSVKNQSHTSNRWTTLRHNELHLFAYSGE